MECARVLPYQALYLITVINTFFFPGQCWLLRIGHCSQATPTDRDYTTFHNLLHTRTSSLWSGLDKAKNNTMPGGVSICQRDDTSGFDLL